MTTTSIETRPSELDRPVLAALGLNWEKATYLLLIAAAFITRFYDLGTRVMSHDESLHTQFAWYLWQGRGFQHSPLMHGVLRFEVTAFFYWLFGANDFVSRVPSALMGVAAVGLMYFFRRWLGRAGALVAALMMLISPYMLYYSRYIRDEPYVVVWGLLVALIVLRFMETRSVRLLYWLAAVTALFYTTMEASYIYVAITMLFLGLHLVRELFAARWPRPELRRPFEIAAMITLAALVIAAGLMVYERTGAPTLNVTSEPANPAATAAAAAQAATMASALGTAQKLAIGIALVGLAVGALLVLRSFGRDIRRFPAFELLMVLGLFVLPQLTAFPVLALKRDPLNYTPPNTAGMDVVTALATFFRSDGGVTLLVAMALIAASVALGWLWDFRLFVICAAIFYAIFFTLFTTFFTNGGGVASGLIGSLAYWLAQHGVRRGGQPWYFYPAIQLPLYEFLPVIGALFAGLLGLRQWLRNEPAREAERVEGAGASAATAGSDGAGGAAATADADDAQRLPFPVIGHFGFWALGALVGFSIAGEKMPWLTTHITLPLILLSGWSIGRFLEGTDWKRLRERRGWLVALVLPVTIVALTAAFGSLLGAAPPFQGTELNQLQATGVFIASALVGAIGVAALYRLGEPLGYDLVTRVGGVWVFVLLALLTARAAFIAAFVNYDEANEFLVYAHGARGVKTVMSQIEDISRRTTDGLGLKVAYDSDVAWPMTWYFRDYYNQSYYGDQPTREALDAPVVIAGPKHWSKVEALLGNRYYMFDYIRMVWPMQDYFNLTWDRVRHALDDPQMRQALWDIWYGRDYTLYGQLTGQTFELSKWPVSEHMRLYVRKDIAAQIWSFGVGPTALEPGITQTDPYVKSRQVLTADLSLGGEGAAQGQFESPRGVAVGPDGSLYVADSRNHRIQKFDRNGNFVLAWGSFGASSDTATAAPGQLNEPWGVGVAPDGSVYVADTWNHRIQHFDANGNFLGMWGHFGQGETLDAFWGPRAVAVDATGRVFVADTGNKRVVVFDKDGNALSSIGGAGSDPGQLDEPVGLAVTADGTLYVADTWNLRFQAFRLDPTTGEYTFLRQVPLEAWFGQSVENKPYLAVDGRGRVYLTDPEGYRVLVFDGDGNFLTTWGDFGSDATTFALASGIAVDSEGRIYVSDPGNHRVQRFPALP